MKPLSELLNILDPGMPHVLEWLANGVVPYEILPKAFDSDKILHQTQVTIKSPMGAIVYETGGILIQGGWIKILGSGHEKIPRTLPTWNKNRTDGYYLFADDFVGGFYAINGGVFGPNHGIVYYWAPDSLEWISMEMNYSNWITWCVSDNCMEFYMDLRWESWQKDLLDSSPEKCVSFYPFLWTKEGSIDNSHRGLIPIQEAFDFKVDLVKQLCQ
jgi:hypothetical protein